MNQNGGEDPNQSSVDKKKKSYMEQYVVNIYNTI